MTAITPNQTDLVRIFLLDDTRELRQRIRREFAAIDGLSVVGEADDPVDGLPLIADLQPDIVVCDLSMPRMDGLEAIPLIAECAPDAGIVVFSGFLGDALGTTTLDLGADRYVEKSAPLEDLSLAVRAVARDRADGLRPATAPVRADSPTTTTAPEREERALDEVIADVIAMPVHLMYGLSLISLLGATGLSVAFDVAPAAFLVFFLSPVAIVGTLGPPRAGIIVSALAAVLFSISARETGVPTWEVGTVGVLIGGLLLTIGGRRLVHWMNQRVEEQAELARELRRSNAELEHFAYVASHDLAAPLRTVDSFTSMLATRYEGKLDPEADKMIGFITAGTARMQRMIDDLLAFARAGRVESGPVPFSLADALDQVRADLASVIGERGALVRNGPLPILAADEPRIAQVLLNLVSNALKFCPEDRAPEVDVTATRLPTGWRIDVRDNGIGVDARFASKVFGMFQRLHGEDEFPGTGIGLAICQRIVERHGGRIWVDGFEGEGSTFSFTLPDTA